MERLPVRSPGVFAYSTAVGLRPGWVFKRSNGQLRSHFFTFSSQKTLFLVFFTVLYDDPIGFSNLAAVFWLTAMRISVKNTFFVNMISD